MKIPESLCRASPDGKVLYGRKYMKDYGTKVVAGTSPGQGGQEVEGIPVYNTVKEAIRAQGPVDISVTFIPGPDLKLAVMEAIDAGIKCLVCPVERVPLHDIMEMMSVAQKEGVTILGPGSIGATHSRQSGGRLAGRKCGMGQSIIPAGTDRSIIAQRRPIRHSALASQERKPGCEHWLSTPELSQLSGHPLPIFCCYLRKTLRRWRWRLSVKSAESRKRKRPRSLKPVIY